MSTKNERFFFVQKHRIEHDKWCEGIRIQNDPGKEYIMDWIEKYAGNFRWAWNQSLCSNCQKYQQCGLLVRQQCEAYNKF